MLTGMTNERTHFLQKLPFATCCTNSEHEFVFVNEAFSRLYRLRPIDVIGKTPWIIATSDFSKELSKAIKTAVTKKGWWSGAVRNRRSDGKQLALQLYALKLPAAHGSNDSEELRLGIVVPQKHRDFLLRFSMELNAELLLAKGRRTQRNLTKRETEVHQLLNAGLKSKEIAEVLGISDSTVRVHLASAKKTTA